MITTDHRGSPPITERPPLITRRSPTKHPRSPPTIDRSPTTTERLSPMSQRDTQRATQHLTTTTTATTQTFFQRLILVHDDNAKASFSSSLTHPFRFSVPSSYTGSTQPLKSGDPVSKVPMMHAQRQTTNDFPLLSLHESSHMLICISCALFLLLSLRDLDPYEALRFSLPSSHSLLPGYVRVSLAYRRSAGRSSGNDSAAARRSI